jgi:hypothetical protein
MLNVKSILKKDLILISNIIRSIIPSVTVFLLLVFLLLNIVFSQLISPLYVRLINNDEQAVTEYLKKIKTLPNFRSELLNYQTIFGKQLVNEVFKEEKERKTMETILEKQLELNPKARDVLYGLYLLYKADSNNNRANYYLGQAKQVDPSIK